MTSKTTRTRSAISTLALVALAASLAPLSSTQVSSAQPTVAAAPSLDRLTGQYRLATSAAERTRRAEAIETVTEDASRLMRRRMRSRLAAKTDPAPQIAIRVRGNSVQLRRGGPALSLIIGGPAVSVNGGAVRARQRGGALVVTARGDNGAITAAYRLSEDGQRLVVRTRLTGERLSSPLVYRVTYRRTS